MIMHMIRRVTCKTAGAESSVSFIALSCAVKIDGYRLILSWKRKCTVPCRRRKSTVPSRRGKSHIPSRPVVKNYMHRPVPSSKKYIPSRPVAKFFINRPVPLWQFLITVPSRHDRFHLSSHPVMKHKERSLYCTFPSRRESSHPPSLPVSSRQL